MSAMIHTDSPAHRNRPEDVVQDKKNSRRPGLGFSNLPVRNDYVKPYANE